MIIKHITYKCDICGKESEEFITSNNIRISTYPNLNCINTPASEDYMNNDINLDICKNCRIKIMSLILEIKNENCRSKNAEENIEINN